VRSLYDRIGKNEINMKDNILMPQNKLTTNANIILVLHGILNIIIHKRGGENELETSFDLIWHMKREVQRKN